MAMPSPEFERLVDAYYQDLYRFAYSLTGHEAEASDLTQQTFYLWAAKGHQLRDHSKVKSWLFTTLHREFLGGHRRRRNHPHRGLDDAGAELPSIEPTVVNAMDGRTVMEALRQVDELYRVPLTLFYLEDLSYAEIAECLGVPIGTVMSRLARGKAALRRALADAVQPSTRRIVPLSRATQP